MIAALDARRKSGRSSIEYRWQCADGSYKHFLDQAVLLKDGEGRPVEFAGTLTDISEQRSLESQLIQAQKMDAIGKLTGGIAHDFNNLLAAVIGGLGLIERRADLGDEEQRILGMTKRAAEQGSELVRRLLAFARRQKLEPHPIDLVSLQEAVSDLLTHTLGGLVKIEWQVGEGRLGRLCRSSAARAGAGQPDHQRARRDAGRRDGHHRRREPASRGRRAGRAVAGDYVRLAVTDNGTGISRGDLEKVMEPFFTTKDVGKGSGLGLSMVYGFAKQSNGAFRIDSELGEARPRSFGFRARRCGPDREGRPQEAEARPKIPNLNVLLVDDHAEVRSTTAAVLEDSGHKVVRPPTVPRRSTSSRRRIASATC